MTSCAVDCNWGAKPNAKDAKVHAKHRNEFSWRAFASFFASLALKVARLESGIDETKNLNSFQTNCSENRSCIDLLRGQYLQSGIDCHTRPTRQQRSHR